MPLPRLRISPSEANIRLCLSLVAAACANLIGSLGDAPPSGWQWVKIIISTVAVVAVNWRAFLTNPQATTTDPPPAPAPAPANAAPAPANAANADPPTYPPTTNTGGTPR